MASSTSTGGVRAHESRGGNVPDDWHVAARIPVIAVVALFALTFIGAAWAFVAVWYVIAFGMFGIFVIPWRMIRRGSRREKAAQKRHDEMVREMRAERGDRDV